MSKYDGPTRGNFSGTAKPGPWFVKPVADRLCFIQDSRMPAASLRVVGYFQTHAQCLEWAERIAARLNQTEGDER